MVGALGGNELLSDMITRGGPEVVQAEMPDEWVDAMSLTGTPQRAAAGIERLLAAGADKVIVVPIVEDNSRETLDAVASLIP